MADWAAKLASKSPVVMRLGKDAMYRQMDMPFDEALDYLRHNLTLALSTEDIQEGVKAFFEKREPEWRGAMSASRSWAFAAAPRTARRPPRAGCEELAPLVGERPGDRAATDRHARASPRDAGFDDDLRDSRGCLLEAGGQVDDALVGRQLPAAPAPATAR